MTYETGIIRDHIIDHQQGFYRAGKLNDGNISFVRITDLTNNGYVDFTTTPKVFVDKENFERFELHKGDFLFARTGGAGKFGLIQSEIKAVFASYLIKFQFKEYLTPSFVRYYFLSDSFQHSLKSRIHGGVNQNIHAEDIKNVEIPIPPIPEQFRIVAKLDSIFERTDKAIALVEQNIDNAKHLMISVLNEMAYSLANEVKNEPFDKYLELSRGHNPPKSKFIYEPKEGYVRFLQIRDGSSDLNAVYVPESRQLKKVCKDDLLLVAYRQVGKVFRGMEGAFNVALCKISNISPSSINTDFVYYLIQTDLVKGELLKRSERALIPSMSVDHLASLQIPIPPLNVQEKVVLYLEEISRKQTAILTKQKQRLVELKALKSSLLDTAFKGEL